MKLLRFNNREDWLDARKGKIMGTKAGSLLSKRDQKPLKGYYELIAERVAIPHDGENVMDRGLRLEEEALDKFQKQTGKKVEKATDDNLMVCVREDFPDIGYSPDGLIGKTEDVEVKCLNSAAHIEAYLTKGIPSEYRSQIIQGFVVNDKLKTRYMVFYDPRMPVDMFFLTLDRKDFKEEIEEYLELEKSVLEEVERITNDLTF